MELKAFSTSTKSTISVLSCWNKSYIAWMAASAPVSWPAHTCKDPATYWTSFFATSIITFLAIRQITSPAPIGRISGFLFRGIERFAMKPSRVSPTSLIDVFKFWCRVFW